MEPSYQTRKMIGRLLLFATLALLAGSFLAHYTSHFVRDLAFPTGNPIRIAVFTKPAMLFSYTPTTRKAHITLASNKCSFEHRDSCFNQTYETFFIPQEKDQNTYWTQFGNNLEQWRFMPLIVWTYVRAYVNALVQKRTNLRPSEFLLLSKELIELTRTDFAIEYPATTKKKKKDTAKIQEEKKISETQPTPLPSRNASTQETPLVVEVLNASGKKGMALNVTQYLREKNAKGLLRVDVLQYDNYPSLQDTSFIVDYSGKQVQVSQISQALSIRGEIRSEKSTTSICNARIVIGKDFKMPL